MIGMNVRMAPYSVPTSSLLFCNVSTHQQVWLLRRELSEQELAELGIAEHHEHDQALA